MNTAEWIRVSHEWEALWAAVESLQEDINHEVEHLMKGEGRGPTLEMCTALKELRIQEQEARSVLDEVIDQLCMFAKENRRP